MQRANVRWWNGNFSSVVRNFESNQIVTSVFDSKRAQLFEIFEYLPSPIFLLIYKFSVNQLPAKIPVTGCTFQLPIIDLYRVKHVCAHAQHVFDLCRRSHQRQTPPSSLPVPHLCSGWGRGGDAYMQSKYTVSQKNCANLFFVITLPNFDGL